MLLINHILLYTIEFPGWRFLLLCKSDISGLVAISSDANNKRLSIAAIQSFFYKKDKIALIKMLSIMKIYVKISIESLIFEPWTDIIAEQKNKLFVSCSKILKLIFTKK